MALLLYFCIQYEHFFFKFLFCLKESLNGGFIAFQGGLKAVMWTDTFQMIIIIAGFLAVLIQGTTETGGFNYIWETARAGGKLDLNK